MDNAPWCFHPTSGPTPPTPHVNCDDFTWTATSPGFTEDFYNKMYQLFIDNLNVDGSGAVVASRDTGTPGGSYFFHWM